MPGILSYSGIATKTKAMKSKLLGEHAFQELQVQSSVPDALAYLKRYPSYEACFENMEDGNVHRGIIEADLADSLYQDYSRLYQFADMTQRKFLSLYFIHYEVQILKHCIRNAYNPEGGSMNLNRFQVFFERHSRLDVTVLGKCTNMRDFVAALKGTVFYSPLRKILDSDQATLYDYESCLDLFYFNYLWKQKDRILKGKDLEVITESFGYQIDLLNLQWIYRAKKYYHMNSVEIYALIIPITYKIKEKEMRLLVEAESLGAYMELIQRTYYSKVAGKELEETKSLEKVYDMLSEKMYSMAARKNPYSLAPIHDYLFQKEKEIGRITTILECIRYGLSPREMAKM